MLRGRGVRPRDRRAASRRALRGIRVRRSALCPCLLAAVAACQRPAALPEPGSYELHPALEMTLWAAEPDVVDPVALTFDAAERMYVVEMRDYPSGVPGAAGRPGGTLRLLEDTDRDGRADRSTVFAEDLSFPTSIVAWKGGVFVTAPPHILYLEDRDGDRRADVREVIFDGFTLGVTDSNVNGLRWGIDNRIHGVNGGNGGSVRAGDVAAAPQNGEEPPDSSAEPAATEIRGLDFRFDPRTRAFETTYHTAAGFGLAFDEWGRSFSPYNIDHLQQRFVPARHLARQRALPPLRATANISVHGAMARIFPISVPATRPNHPEQAGHYSAAGGIGYLDFAGEGLPRGILVCDVVGNLVSREVPRFDGPVYVSERAPEEADREFLASRDPAFRPVAVEMGPDGALYLADMQRDVIEHPDYIPASRRLALDQRAGDDRGRIYRIAPRQARAAAQPPLAGATSALLMAALAGPSRWRRDTAQRLLIERGKAPIEELRAMVEGRRGGGREGGTAGEAAVGDDPSVEAWGRLHALWTLHGLGAAGEEVVIAALDDPEPGVRENALRVAESLLPGSQTLDQRIVAMADDPSARVRFQAALTLGDVLHPGREAALDRILRRDARHRWSRVAVATALGDGADRALAAVLRWGDAPDVTPTIVRELADLAGAGLAPEDDRALDSILRASLDPRLPPALAAAAIAGLDSGLARAARPPPEDPSSGAWLDRAMSEHESSTVAAAWRLRRALGLTDGPAQAHALASAMRRAGDATLAAGERAAALDLVALGPRDVVAGPLIALLAANQPSEVQARAITVLAGVEPVDLGSLLVERFRGLGPSARGAAISLLLRRPAFHPAVVAALEDGRLTAAELHLDLEGRRRLLRSEAPGVAERAAALLDDDDYGNRAAVVETWLARLPTEGSTERGRAVFGRLCAQCHRMGGVGHAVGPDLESLRHRSAEDLVSSILDPDLAIPPSYVAFELTLGSGDLEVGLIEAESGAAVTLLVAGGARRVIPRDQITAMASTGRSPMPAGLEQGLEPQDLRDLVTLIQDGTR